MVTYANLMVAHHVVSFSVVSKQTCFLHKQVWQGGDGLSL